MAGPENLQLVNFFLTITQALKIQFLQKFVPARITVVPIF